MKKRILFLVVIISCLLLSACVGDPNSNPDTDPNQNEDSTPTDNDTPNTPTNDVVELLPTEYTYYYEKYLSAWVLPGLMYKDFDEDSFLSLLNVEQHTPYFLYSDGLCQERHWDEHEELYDTAGRIPADYVELIVSRHFPITAKEYRKLYFSSPGGYESYNEKTNSYNFPGGYGGSGLTGKIYKGTKEGNIITLWCEWFNYENTFELSHKVTILLGDSPLEFKYIRNQVTTDSPNR
jgi:hypothetical protein